jgi:hypothetical protein
VADLVGVSRWTGAAPTSRTAQAAKQSLNPIRRMSQSCGAGG